MDSMCDFIVDSDLQMVVHLQCTYSDDQLVQ